MKQEFTELQSEWETLVVACSHASLHAVDRRRMPGRYALYALLEEVSMELKELQQSGALQNYKTRYVTSAWALKDLAAHLASWAAEISREVEVVSREDSFGYVIPYALSVIGPTEWNQQEVEKRKRADISELLNEFHKENRSLQEKLLVLPPAGLYRPAEFPVSPSGDPGSRLKSNIAMMVFGMVSHYRYHLRHIRNWLRINH